MYLKHTLETKYHTTKVDFTTNSIFKNLLKPVKLYLKVNAQ